MGCLKGRTESCSTIVKDYYLESLLLSDVRKGTLYSHDRTESDNRIEVTYLEGMVENNLSHTESHPENWQNIMLMNWLQMS